MELPAERTEELFSVFLRRIHGDRICHVASWQHLSLQDAFFFIPDAFH